MRALDQILGRRHRVRPADLGARAVLALQQHVRRKHERARQHIAPARHEHRAAAVRRRGRERGVEGVRVGVVVVRLGAVVLDVEDVVLPDPPQRGDGPDAGVVAVLSARQAVRDLHGVGARLHVRGHLRVQAPHVGPQDGELSPAEPDGDAIPPAVCGSHGLPARGTSRDRGAGVLRAIRRERPAEDAQHAARRRRIPSVALQPPDRRRVERERRGGAVRVHDAPLHDRLAVRGEREDEARVGEHGRLDRPSARLDARGRPPVAAVHEHPVARAYRITRPRHHGLAAPRRRGQHQRRRTSRLQMHKENLSLRERLAHRRSQGKPKCRRRRRTAPGSGPLPPQTYARARTRAAC